MNHSASCRRSVHRIGNCANTNHKIIPFFKKTHFTTPSFFYVFNNFFAQKIQIFRKMPPKKAPGITVILVDAGPNMSKRDEKNGKNDFEKAIDAADWIVSRKVFQIDFEQTPIILFSYSPKTPRDSL